MKKPIINQINANNIHVTGTDIDIQIEKVNGYIRFKHKKVINANLMQLTEKDAQALGEALVGITKI